MNTITGTLLNAPRRVGTSTMGNPTYEVDILETETDSVHWRVRTMSNAGFAYAICNPEYRELEHVFELTRAGRIRSARRVA